MRSKKLACLLGIIAPWMLLIGTAGADEIFTPTATVTIPGGVNAFDIGFVDADIHTYAFADRTNATVDIIDTKTNTLVKQLTAMPPFAGVRASPGASSGPDGVIIVDHREVWAGDGPASCNGISCTPSSTNQPSRVRGLGAKRPQC